MAMAMAMAIGLQRTSKISIKMLLSGCTLSRSSHATSLLVSPGLRSLAIFSSRTPVRACFLLCKSFPMLSPPASAVRSSALSNDGAPPGANEASWAPGGGGADGGPGGGGGGGKGGDGGFGHGRGVTGDETARKSFISLYLMLLNNHPVATKAITSALLTFLGDLFCQLVFEKRETVDLKRIGIFTLLGLILVGPTLHFWYLNLSKLIPGPGPVKAALRLVLDQFVFAPIFIGVFFSALLTLEGRPSEIVLKLQQDWLGAVVTNWKIWIPFQFLNFLLVPQQLQVLAANVIALAWNTYLSFATHTTVMPPSGKEAVSS